jgi:hypothetical protein
MKADFDRRQVCGVSPVGVTIDGSSGDDADADADAAAAAEEAEAASFACKPKTSMHRTPAQMTAWCLTTGYLRSMSATLAASIDGLTGGGGGGGGTSIHDRERRNDSCQQK